MLKKGLSNLSNLSLTKNCGPRLAKAAKPAMLRSLTGMSWTTDQSDGKSKDESDPGGMKGIPKLTKSASKISFSSWRSGSSAGDARKNKKKPDQRYPSEDEELKDGERRIKFFTNDIRAEPAALHDPRGGQPNKIRTAKFTITTWLPKSLFAQFQRVANIYFSFIVILVLFPWSPKDPKSKILPFGMVLLWTALKDLHEDSRRRRDDALENNQKTRVFDLKGDRNGTYNVHNVKKFVSTSWADIKVGDVIIVEADKAFPADLLLLHAGGSYEAFISTISLDGETNLKERRPPSICDNFTSEVNLRASGSQKFDLAKATDQAVKLMHEMHTSHFSCKVGAPEVAVQDIRGSLFSNQQPDMCPIAINNFLPRGCTLRNTSWVLALVLFVGDETKTRLNNAQAKGKVSNMQKYLNQCVWGLLIGLAVVCSYAATMSALQEDTFSFCCSDESWMVRLGIFCVTFYHVVPMSLYVVFEMLKLFVLGYQVNSDKQMVDPVTKEPAVARTTDLIEEMGQINFVFSDKTGTLTKNEMVFARACVEGKDVGDFRRKENEREAEGVVKVKHGITSPETCDTPYWKDVHWFFTCLATCHSVQVQMNDTSVQEASHATGGTAANSSPRSDETEAARSRYLGMSPDEVALVEASAQVGIVFEKRLRQGGASGSTSSEVTLTCPDGGTQVFSIMYELEFNSDRKRMSVVMRHSNEIYVVTKGADSVMEPLLTENFNATYQDHLKQYSQCGLRTLVVAYKKVDKTAFKTWEREYKAAQNILSTDKDAKVDEVAAQLETEMNLVGITAVEDCLQDGVPDTIKNIKEAGVRVWVLTGDKTETAVDIARSCNLFADGTTLAYATEATTEALALEKLQAAKHKLEGIANAGLVLDGRTIQYCLPSEECKTLIFELGMASRSCVCCRLTPLQKRNLVELVRDRDKQTITLAIGDGANDVPMIEGAHLGIAVRGKEGAQAVQVSDVAISQFRFLQPLLFCHGRRAYRRIAVYLCYYLYKNVALAMGDVVWMHMDKYRGRIAFPEYLSINYNVFFTSWHILFVLGFDRDVPDYIANSHPELYHCGPKRLLFNKKVFSSWMVYAIIHGAVAWIVPYFMVSVDSEYDKLNPTEWWEGSVAALTILVLIVLIKLLFSCQSPFKLTSSVAPTAISIAMYIVVLAGIAYMPPFQNKDTTKAWQPNMKAVPVEMLKNAKALIAIAAVPAGVTIIELISEVVRKQSFPTPLDQVKNGLRTGAIPSEPPAGLDSA
jgi:phospholipid-translocating P-type ATPase (flippase)